MAGSNPYIEQAEFEPATQPFTVTFQPGNVVVKVDPAEIPYDRTGLPGSILDIAFGADIEIDHACGGVCACSTCHVKVREGNESCNPSSDDEEDMLDEARDVDLDSRLACQCVPNGKCDLVVEIPAWNRNLVKEHD